MKNILHIKYLYLDAFKDLKNAMVKLYFMAFSWFCFAIIAIVLYAFVSRLATGYAF